MEGRGDDVAFEAVGVFEVEVFQGLAGEPGGIDPADPAVRLVGGDLSLQAGDQRLLRGPGLGTGPLGQPAADSRRVGAFSARLRKAMSAARSRAVVMMAGIRLPRRQRRR